jgi:protein-S-isoprenylcysteine O-methyltransferase Ste14
MVETITSERPELLPPTYWFGCALLMITIHVFFPLFQWSEPWLTSAGAGLIAAAGLVGGWAAWTFHRRGTPIHPFEPAQCLVTDGPYRYSRNPMYLCLLVMLLGLWLVLGSVTPVVVVIAFETIISTRFIGPEEDALESRYGDAFRHYKATVRRWI